ESLGGALKVFGLGTDSAMGMASAVDALADSTSASAAGIFDVTNRLQGVARAVGLTLPQTVALSTARLDVRIHSEVAGTAMSKILGMMEGEGEGFGEATGAEGEMFKQLAKDSPLEALRATLKKMSEMQGPDAFAFLAELGIDGERAKGVMLQLGQTLERLDPL